PRRTPTFALFPYTTLFRSAPTGFDPPLVAETAPGCGCIRSRGTPAHRKRTPVWAGYRLHRRASAGSRPANARGEIMDPRRASTTSRSGTQLGSDAAALNSAGDAPWRLNR